MTDTDSQRLRRQPDATHAQRAQPFCRQGSHYWRHVTSDRGLSWLRLCETCGVTEQQADACARGEHMPRTWGWKGNTRWTRRCYQCGDVVELTAPRCECGRLHPAGMCDVPVVRVDKRF